MTKAANIGVILREIEENSGSDAPLFCNWYSVRYVDFCSFGGYAPISRCRMWSAKALQKSAKIKVLIISALGKIGRFLNFGEWQTSDKNFAFFGKHLQMRHPLFYLFLCRFLPATSNPFFFQTGRFPTRHLRQTDLVSSLACRMCFLVYIYPTCRKSTKHLRHCRCWLKLSLSSYINTDISSRRCIPKA